MSGRLTRSAACSLCHSASSEKTITIEKKALNNLITKSRSKKDNKWKQWQNRASVIVHTSCQETYINTNNPLPEPVQPSTSFQSPSTSFNFAENCYLCAEPCETPPGNMKNLNISQIRKIATRRNDALGQAVQARLRGVTSLKAPQARYHQECYDRFAAPLPEDADPFKPVYDFISSSENRQFSIDELLKLMGEPAKISKEELWQKLKEKFNQAIRVSSDFNFVLYQKSQVKKKNWHDIDSLTAKEKDKIFDAAASILREEIKSQTYETDSFAAPHDFLNSTNTNTPLLDIFLETIMFSSKREPHADDYLKMDSIKHAIIAAICPETFQSNIQHALGTYLDNKAGGKSVIELLSALGVCASSEEIQQQHESYVMDPATIKVTDAFVQYVFDNSDANIQDFEGTTTLHCLGGIAVYTPASGVSFEGRSKKCKETPTTDELRRRSMLRAIPYDFPERESPATPLIDLNSLDLGNYNPLPPLYSTFLWAKHYSVGEIPNFLRFMEVAVQDLSYQTSCIVCLPFIDETSADRLTPLNTVLHYARTEADKLGQQTCFASFDLPLYLKARRIVMENEDSLKNVVVRLGGYHLLMSYLRAIGLVMEGSGIEELWKTIYGGNNIKKIKHSFIIQQALRAHLITFTALGIIICQAAEGEKNTEYSLFLQTILRKWQFSKTLRADCQTQSVAINMAERLSAQLNAMKQNGPTAQLWIQYFELVLIALQFIEAERTGNWQLHLQSVRKMLPLFYATGHLGYSKSAQVYFTIRRNDTPWSGVWTDLAVEQSVNSHLGADLKFGKQLDPDLVTKKLATMPSTATIISNLEQYANLNQKDQFLDRIVDSPEKKDEADLGKFLTWFQKHQPFIPRDSLVSLATGASGAADTNCHQAVELGSQAMRATVGLGAERLSLPSGFELKSLVALFSLSIKKILV